LVQKTLECDEHILQQSDRQIKELALSASLHGHLKILEFLLRRAKTKIGFDDLLKDGPRILGHMRFATLTIPLFCWSDLRLVWQAWLFDYESLFHLSMSKDILFLIVTFVWKEKTFQLPELTASGDQKRKRKATEQ